MNRQQVEINRDVKTTLACIETLLTPGTRRRHGGWSRLSQRPYRPGRDLRALITGIGQTA